MTQRKVSGPVIGELRSMPGLTRISLTTGGQSPGHPEMQGTIRKR